MGKRVILLGVVIVLFSLNIKVVSASLALIVDGSFSDWDTIEHINVSASSTVYEQVAIVYDEQFIYMHVIEKKSDKWSTNYPTLTISCDNTSKDIVIVRNDYSGNNGITSLSVKNSWYQDINNAEAKNNRKGNFNEWEIKIPIYDIFLPAGDETSNNVKPIAVNQLTTSWNIGGAVTINAVYKGEPFPTPTPNPDYDPGNGMTIDGYFDDWEMLPKTEFSYNKNQVNYASFIMDGSYIYVYYAMNPKNKWIPLDGINIDVNGVTSQMFVRYANSDGTVDWSKDVSNLSGGIHNQLSTFTYGYNNTLGSAAVHIADSNKLELRISIETLEEALGLEPGTISNGSTLSLKLPNLGNGEIVMEGVSTGSITGIIITLGLALIFLYRKKIPRNSGVRT